MKTWFVALGIVLGQIAIALAFAKAPDLNLAYRQLCQWDSEWYYDIAERGYASYLPVPPPGHAKDNGGFFPGYPIAARMLHIFLGFDTEMALLLVAQSAAVIFWVTFLLLLKRWQIGSPYQALAILAVLAHPCSFYLVVGYPEPLFCASLMLMFFFSLVRTPWSLFGTASSGFVLSATRLLGVPFAGLPVLNWLMRRRPLFGAALAVAVISVLGAGMFFLFCKIHFGEFTHYIKTQKEGWGVTPEYLAVFQAGKYDFWGNYDAKAFAWTPVALLATVVGELYVVFRSSQDAFSSRRRKLWRIRMPWYLMVFVSWYIASSGVASVEFRSLIRYSFPWTIILIISWIHYFNYSIRLPRVAKAVLFAIVAILLSVVFSSVTLHVLNDYLHGQWVS